MSKDNVTQEIYISLDDSGKLTQNEIVSVYGGMVFFSKSEKDKFITQYRSIVYDIKCKYCEGDRNYCNRDCPEIKNTNINPADKRRLMNYIKKHFVLALVIKNSDVHDHIMSDKGSKGRFTDYAIRRLIKGALNRIIRSKGIDPAKPVKLIINIDQQTTKNNGYYNLRDGLYEELRHGIANYDYGIFYKPLFSNRLDITLAYQDSERSYVVQAADLLAGTIRRKAVDAVTSGKNIYQEVSNLAQFTIVLP